MPICKYLIQRGRRIGEQNGKSFKAFRKIKNKKKTIKILSFIIQEFLLPVTGCRKMLGKMSAGENYAYLS